MIGSHRNDSTVSAAVVSLPTRIWRAYARIWSLPPLLPKNLSYTSYVKIVDAELYTEARELMVAAKNAETNKPFTPWGNSNKTNKGYALLASCSVVRSGACGPHQGLLLTSLPNSCYDRQFSYRRRATMPGMTCQGGGGGCIQCTCAGKSRFNQDS